ncbi:MAG: hypothetical protein WCO23_03310 [bacterium]
MSSRKPKTPAQVIVSHLELIPATQRAVQIMCIAHRESQRPRTVTVCIPDTTKPMEAILCALDKSVIKVTNIQVHPMHQQS